MATNNHGEQVTPPSNRRNTPTAIITQGKPTVEDQALLSRLATQYTPEIVAQWTAAGFELGQIEFLEKTIPVLVESQKNFVGNLVRMGNLLEIAIRESLRGQLAYILGRAGVSEDVALMARHIYRAVTKFPQLAEMS